MVVLRRVGPGIQSELHSTKAQVDLTGSGAQTVDWRIVIKSVYIVVVQGQST